MMSKSHSKTQNELLELPTRKKIYRIVEINAGCHFREIERKCRLSTGVVKYHLNYLTKHELIRQEKQGNNVRYFPRGIGEEDKKLLGFLRQKSLRKIILLLMIHKNCTHKDIVSLIKLSPSTVSWHLKHLTKEEIISSNEKTYKLEVEKNEILNLLITYKKSLLDSLADKVIEMWGLS